MPCDARLAMGYLQHNQGTYTPLAPAAHTKQTKNALKIHVNIQYGYAFLNIKNVYHITGNSNLEIWLSQNLYI